MPHESTGARTPATACLGVLLLVAAGAVRADDWGYGAANGPTHWCDLGHATCCESSKAQSPINILTRFTVTERRPALSFRYTEPTAVTVKHNGRSVQADVTGVRWVEIGGTPTRLKQFHFHTQSEHTVDGEHFPMEMHLVHTADDGRITVVGVFIEVGAAHPELGKLWTDLPAAKGDVASVDGLDLDRLLPADRTTTWQYDGSLTTPGCDEGVAWIVMVEPITMSAEQIRKFAQLFSGEAFPHGNRRHVQPLRNRTVFVTNRGASDE